MSRSLSPAAGRNLSPAPPGPLGPPDSPESSRANPLPSLRPPSRRLSSGGGGGGGGRGALVSAQQEGGSGGSPNNLREGGDDTRRLFEKRLGSCNDSGSEEGSPPQITSETPGGYVRRGWKAAPGTEPASSRRLFEDKEGRPGASPVGGPLKPQRACLLISRKLGVAYSRLAAAEPLSLQVEELQLIT